MNILKPLPHQNHLSHGKKITLPDTNGIDAGRQAFEVDLVMGDLALGYFFTIRVYDFVNAAIGIILVGDGNLTAGGIGVKGKCV